MFTGVSTGVELEFDSGNATVNIVCAVITHATNAVFLVELILKLVATGGDWNRYFFPSSEEALKARTKDWYREVDKEYGGDDEIGFDELKTLVKLLGNKFRSNLESFDELLHAGDDELSAMELELKEAAVLLKQKNMSAKQKNMSDASKEVGMTFEEFSGKQRDTVGRNVTRTIRKISEPSQTPVT